MAKQRTLSILPIMCLLVLFLLTIFSGKAGAEDSETSEAVQDGEGSSDDSKSRERIFLKKGQIDDAISDLNKAMALNPEDAGAYFYRGTAHFGKKKYRKALSDYNKAIELDPEYVNAYINRGYYYHTRNEYHKAMNDYSKALELNPMSPTVKEMLESAFTDRDLYQNRVQDNTRAGDMGVVIRQNRVT